MKFKVSKSLVRRAENMKQYKPGDSIELTKEEGEALEAQGFVEKELKAKRTTKEQKSPKKTK